MKTRHIISLIFLLFTISALADKKITIRNADAGESFEMSVPNGLTIYEYNSNRLDSVPYLVERARYGEPWAYEALGDCYRYGKGVQMSVFNSYSFYQMAGIDVEDKVAELEGTDPHSPFVVIYNIIKSIDRRNFDNVIELVDTLYSQGYHSIEMFKYCMENAGKPGLRDEIKTFLLSEESDADACLLVGLSAGVMNLEQDSESRKLSEDVMKWLLMAKLPYINSFVGIELFHKYKDGESLSDETDNLKFAITCLELADKHAALEREGAAILYNHYKSEMADGRMPTDADNMNRLATLAKLPESERIIFTDRIQ